ncbi:tRNA (adenosine(37)-N6)-dimethylallyltransferase MiaA [Acetobacter musti]
MMDREQAGRVALIVAGPTCSGKSALAITLGERFGGTIINADSMQVYRELRILTARPSPQDEERLPHRLYGISPAAEARSVAWWRQQALSAMDEAWKAGRLPVLCGGTGMYLRALTDGLAEVPDPGSEARAEARALSADPASLHARLMEADPETGQGLRPTDTQRLARAWEVWRGTGHGLSWWRAQPGLPRAPCRFIAVRLAPDRSELRRAIVARFRDMMTQGAVDEVRALLALELSPALPAMRAHGVPELAAMLRGETDEQEAVARAVQATCRYTKRQTTWFGHHPLAEEHDMVISENRIGSYEQYMKRKIEKIISFVHERIDAAPSGA